MRDQMKTNPDKGYVVGCFVVGRGDERRALFQGHDDNTVTAHLDRYTVLPNELFQAMGGTDNPAYVEWFERRRAAGSVSDVTLPILDSA